MKTAVIHDPLCARHDPGHGHPERPERYHAALAGARAATGGDPACEVAPRQASDEEVRLCHTADYIASVRADVADGIGALRTGDTDVCEWSFDAALRAAACALTAVDTVFGPGPRRAFCPVRPPGHHASAARGMGFCIFNNVALAARYAQERHGAERVLIVDWDVHHGNGTQDLFYADPTVLFFSVHQYPLYPGTGAAHEAGAGAGRGTTINCPLPAGAGGREMAGKLRAKLLPAAAAFRPDLVVLSAGFDAWVGDPIGGLAVTAQDFADVTRIVVRLADAHAGGRLVSVLEGGYDLDGLRDCVAAHVSTLME